MNALEYFSKKINLAAASSQAKAGQAEPAAPQLAFSEAEATLSTSTDATLSTAAAAPTSNLSGQLSCLVSSEAGDNASGESVQASADLKNAEVVVDRAENQVNIT